MITLTDAQSGGQAAANAAAAEPVVTKPGGRPSRAAKKEAPPPDERVIVFPKDGPEYKRVAAISGTNDVIEYVIDLAISPNGKFLLSSVPGGSLDYGKLTHLRVFPVDGSPAFDLVDIRGAFRGSWSPDGKRIACQVQHEALWLVPVSSDSGRPTGPASKLLDGDFSNTTSPSWLPDSEQIVFEKREAETNSQLHILFIRDRRLRQLTSEPGLHSSPVWSTDGKTIAYKSGDAALRVNCRGWTIPAEGGTPRQVSEEGEPLLWLPDLQWLLRAIEGKLRFTRLTDQRSFEVVPPQDGLTPFGWSPEGKSLLFYRTSYHERNVLKALSVVDGTSRYLGRELWLVPHDLFWSPDSKLIVVPGGQANEPTPWPSRLWILPLSGLKPSELEWDVSIPGDVAPRSLSPDGKRLLLSACTNMSTEDLWVAPVSLTKRRATGPARKVLSNRNSDFVGNALLPASWSPDSTKLATIHQNELWIIPAGGGHPVQVTRNSDRKAGMDWLEWSPDGTLLACTERLASHSANALRVVPASGGEARTLMLGPYGCARNYTWTPKGREIVVGFAGQIWAVPVTGALRARWSHWQTWGWTLPIGSAGRRMARVSRSTEPS